MFVRSIEHKRHTKASGMSRLLDARGMGRHNDILTWTPLQVFIILDSSKAPSCMQCIHLRQKIILHKKSIMINNDTKGVNYYKYIRKTISKNN